MNIELNNFLACHVARVSYFNLNGDLYIKSVCIVYCRLELLSSSHKRLLERRIRHAVAEGIYNFLVVVKALVVACRRFSRRSLVVLVTQINTLFVFNGLCREHRVINFNSSYSLLRRVVITDVGIVNIGTFYYFACNRVDSVELLQRTEVLPGGILREVGGINIYKPAGRIDFAVEYSSDCIKAGYTRLTNPQNGVDAFIFLKLAEFHGIGNIQKNYDFVEVCLYVFYKRLLVVVQLEIMLGLIAVRVEVLDIQIGTFATRTGYGYDCRIVVVSVRSLRRVKNGDIVLYRLCLIALRSGLCHIGISFIASLDLTVYLKSCRFQTVGKGDIITATAA